MDSKIIPFPKRPAIFGPKTRAALVEGIKSEETVNQVEDILCREFVATARTLGHKFGQFLGAKLGKVFDQTVFKRTS